MSSRRPRHETSQRTFAGDAASPRLDITSQDRISNPAREQQGRDLGIGRSLGFELTLSVAWRSWGMRDSSRLSAQRTTRAIASVVMPRASCPPPRAESDHGDDPERRGGGDALDHVASTQDRTAADEPHAREDAERQPHEVEAGERVGGFSPQGNSRFVWIMATAAARQTSIVVRSPAAWPRSLRSMPTSVPAMIVRASRRAIRPIAR